MRYLSISITSIVLGVASANFGAAEPFVSTGRAVILVLPFSTPPDSTQAWMGTAVQRDLETDLMEGTQASVIAPSTAPAAADSAQALKTARELGANFVVFGQVQISSTDVRLTGQVLNVADAKPLGPLKATGASADLFHLEDAVAGQTLGLLPRSLLSAQAAGALSRPAAAPQTSAPEQNALPQVVTPPPDNTSSLAPGGYAAAPQPSYYTYAPPSSDFYPGYVVAAPSYSYACPVPAYTYWYPSCDLFPFFGFGFVGVFGDDFDHGHRFDHNRGHWDGGNQGHGTGHGEGLHTGRPLAGNGAGGHVGGASNENRGQGIPRASGPRFEGPSVARPGAFRDAPAGIFRASPRVSGSFGGGIHSGGSFGEIQGGGSGGGFHGGGGASHVTGGGRR